MDFLQAIKSDIYSLMIFSLAVSTLASIYQLGAWQNLINVFAAIFVASLLDLGIKKYWRKENLKIPKSAIISGFFVSAVLEQSTPLLAIIAAAAIAILSKHIISLQGKHIFNPANFGMLSAILFLQATHGWWASISPIAILLGLIVVWRFERFHQVAPFLFVYYLANFAFNQTLPTLDFTLLFFTFFMFIEPKTSPSSRNARIIYGALSGIIIFAATIFAPTYSIFAGLAVANILGFFAVNRFIK